MKRVIARLLVNEASLHVFKQCAQSLIEKSRAEDGNISYDLYQNVTEGSGFLFVEHYRDQEALDHHFTSEHLERFLIKVKPLLQGEPEIIIDEMGE